MLVSLTRYLLVTCTPIKNYYVSKILTPMALRRSSSKGAYKYQVPQNTTYVMYHVGNPEYAAAACNI